MARLESEPAPRALADLAEARAHAIILRHARAGDRAGWRGDDRLRPLDDHGRGQAEALVERLMSAGLQRIYSSPSRRCVATVEPLAWWLGLRVELDDGLAEGASRADTLALASDGALLCTHGDVIERLLGAPLRKGEAVAVTLEDGVIDSLAPLP